MQVAVLITCYNRREATLACLGALYRQALPCGASLHVYLVDDGSTDGTGDAVRTNFPEVRVVAGDGCLYWGGGMRCAWAHAFRLDYAYYLWLNDDCVLLPYALTSLLRTAGSPDDPDVASIAVGSTRDPGTGNTSYGGHLLGKVDRMLSPSDRAQECHAMNGNVVLIPRVVAKVVGNISPEFTHYFGDFDYGLRARRCGFRITVAPGYAGECAANNHAVRWCDPDVPFVERWREFHSPKGQRPYEVFVFARRHRGAAWPIAILRRYLRLIAPGPWTRLQQWRKVHRSVSA